MEMAALARQEREDALELLREVDHRIINNLAPRDVDDDRGVVVEVRAGTGTSLQIHPLWAVVYAYNTHADVCLTLWMHRGPRGITVCQ